MKCQLCNAGLLIIVPVVPWEAGPRRREGGGGEQLPTFYHAVLASEFWENVHKPQVSCRPTYFITYFRAPISSIVSGVW